jgi:BirA family transcriptional regulator, biotin operon repressor / biotin---[acetyl-CoA-carboxylase] ligase
MIKQIHLNECDSTQEVLKEQISHESLDEHTLVSCERQRAGRGRQDRSWISMDGTLCLSLRLSATPVASLSALEVAVLVAQFYEERGIKLGLKWPNDLLDPAGKKCAGILLQGSGTDMLAGIGINYFSSDPLFGGLYPHEVKLDKKAEALALAAFILGHRYPDACQLIKQWNNRCSHMGKMVLITEGEEIHQGIFEGIGEFGEALLETSHKKIRLFNGTLRSLESP